MRFATPTSKSIHPSVTRRQDLYTSRMPPKNATSSDADYIFNRVGVKAALIAAYAVVFFCCVVGNLLVVLAIVLHRRMRTATNLFLVNLAIADLCVGVFCVFQNLAWFLLQSWPLGDFLCQMHHFVQYLSTTASIAILTLIAAERYLAIVHPIRSKRLLTAPRLCRAMGVVWAGAIAFSGPRFFMYGTETFQLRDGRTETICLLRRQLYDSRAYDSVNFVLCYVVPLALISAMYACVGVRLWRRCPGSAALPTRRRRRKVVRMLVAVVLSFAVCNLPFHARKLWQYWAPHYDGTSDAAMLATPVTFLILFANSGANPFLYALLSGRFHRSMRDVVACRATAPRHDARRSVTAMRTGNGAVNQIFRSEGTMSITAPPVD